MATPPEPPTDRAYLPALQAGVPSAPWTELSEKSSSILLTGESNLTLRCLFEAMHTVQELLSKYIQVLLGSSISLTLFIIEKSLSATRIR